MARIQSRFAVLSGLCVVVGFRRTPWLNTSRPVAKSSAGLDNQHRNPGSDIAVRALGWIPRDGCGSCTNRQEHGSSGHGFVVGLFLVAVQFSFVTLAGHIGWVRTAEKGVAPVTMALIAYLLLACREELAFRGYPLRRLDHVFGAWTAQIVVALVFAIEHRVGGYSWSNAIFGAFVGSLLFGAAALATRGLAVPIGLHAAWNLGTWAIGEKDLPGLWNPVVEAGFETRAVRIGMVSYLVVFSSATLAFWWWQHRPKNNPQ